MTVTVDSRGRGGGPVDSFVVLNNSDPVPDEPVGRQDLPLDETVANALFVRLLCPSKGARKAGTYQISMDIQNNQAKYCTVLYCNVR